jgi:hypothetical protein
MFLPDSLQRPARRRAAADTARAALPDSEALSGD